VPRYRDSSAGACAACGLTLLAELVPPHEAPVYRQAAEKILHSLYANYGAWDDPAQEGLILAGTGRFPAGQNIEVSLIYGDYYFVEGLSRLRGNTELFWQFMKFVRRERAWRRAAASGSDLLAADDAQNRGAGACQSGGGAACRFAAGGRTAGPAIVRAAGGVRADAGRDRAVAGERDGGRVARP